jgi:hypothetical protein
VQKNVVSDRSSEGGVILRALLAELGWSMSGFAERVRMRCRDVGTPRTVSVSTVARWCGGAVPGPDLSVPACSVLSVALRRHVDPGRLGWPGYGIDVAVEALEYRDLHHAVRVLARLWQVDATAQRSLVCRMSFGPTVASVSQEALVMPPDTDIAGPGDLRISDADIELLEMHTDLYGRMDARHGGGRFRSVFAAFLDNHATPLLNGGFSDRRGRRLYGSVADAALALGSMAYDDQLPGLARRYDVQGMRLAQAIGDRGRLVRGYIHQARLAAARGEAGEVLTQARTAVFAAVGTPASVRAYAAITEARAWAYNQNPDQTLAAVRRSRGLFSQATGATGPRWMRWLDRPELEGAGHGRPGRAGYRRAPGGVGHAGGAHPRQRRAFDHWGGAGAVAM